MEAKLKVAIPCPSHPNENVQRVHLGLGEEKELYCIECLMSLSNPQSVVPKLKPFQEFIELAAKFYKSSQTSGAQGGQIPKEYQSVLDNQSEFLEALSQHLEKEKTKIHSKFDDLQHILLQIVSQAREDHIQLLDTQYNNLKNNFSFFEKQCNKLYGQSNNQDLPTKEDIIEKLNNAANISELLESIKSIKQDLNESSMLASEGNVDPAEARKKLMAEMLSGIEEEKVRKPTYKDVNIDDLKSEINKAIKKVLEKNLALSDTICDVTSGTAQSNILKKADFDLTRNLLNPEYSRARFKLIYRGSKDGMHLSNYHEKLGSSAPTYTVIKTKDGHYFGVFLDKPFVGDATKIVDSPNTLLISYKTKQKYVYSNPDTYQDKAESAYSAHDGLDFGQSDIYIAADFANGYHSISPYAFIFTAHDLIGDTQLQIEDIEAFELTK